MNPPDTPDTPGSRGRAPSDDEAARLLEVGLSTPAAGGRTPPPSPAEAGSWFPQLEILELLGQGGMGVVYKARQKTLDRIVALKILPQHLSQDPAFAERFTREARTLARLQHPHIVGVHEFGDVDGRYYLLMEYVDGVNLRQLMDTQALTPDEALAIVPQVCEALQYAHDLGIVHRDIKPENVLLDRAGRVKVADFGLAKLTQPGASEFTLTGTGQVMGTLHYMAPEQYRTPQDVDHRADIFSLGVVFYEMLTGELPVGRFANPSATKDLDARLDEIVLKTLERERDLRYQQAREVQSEVTTLSQPAQGAPPLPPPAPPAHDGSRHGLGARHAARREARHGGKRFSTWAKVAVISFLLCLVLVPLAYGFVREFSRPGPALQIFHATVAASLTATIGLALTAVLALVATLVTAHAKDAVRGHALAMTLLVVSAVGAPTAFVIGGVAIEKANARLRRLGPNDLPHFGPQVEGARSQRAEDEIREDIRRTWEEYLRRMKEHDLYVDETKSLYSREDWGTLTTLSPDELREGREARTLGMGLVGRGRLSAPPWEFRVTRIDVHDWDRTATVTAAWNTGGSEWTLAQKPDGSTGWERLQGSTQTLQFPMKRESGHWVFSIGEVVLEDGVPAAERENK
jgi:serine/threonine protein kinase